MSRKKKEELSPLDLREQQLREWELRLKDREERLDNRDAIMAQMPDGDMSSVDEKKWFNKNRKSILASMFELATKSPSEKTRKDMLLQLNAMDVGKPGMKRKTDGDDVDAVVIQHGTYGV